MQISDLVNLIGDGVLATDFVDKPISGACIDSRKVVDGNLFFACKGENIDGNSFAQQALYNGAAVVIMDNKKFYDNVVGSKILVENSIEAIKRAGNNRLKDEGLIKIAITGSYGKTTTKEILKLVLSKSFKVHATAGNNNNELGVCLTASGIPKDTRVAIFEVGTNAMGEIAHLAGMIRPHIAIITGIGHAHIGKFGDMGSLAQEKLSIVDYLHESGVVVADEVFRTAIKFVRRMDASVYFGVTDCSDVRMMDALTDGRRTAFKIVSKDIKLPVMINSPYLHTGHNFLPSVIVGRLLNMSYESIVDAVQGYVMPEGRGSILGLGDVTIINDCYNSSLEAVLKAYESLEQAHDTPKYALIGGIGEIEGYEEEIYKKIYDRAKLYEGVNFIFYGDGYRGFKPARNIYICEDERELFRLLNNITKGLVLIKASRVHQFEKYVEYFKERNR